MPVILSYDGSSPVRLFGSTFSNHVDVNKWKKDILECAKPEIYFEVPLVSQDKHDDIACFIDWLARRFKASVIINDYGMLYYCQKYFTSGAGKPEIIAGRLIGYQYNSIPWVSVILNGETEYIKTEFNKNYFHSERKISFLKKLNVSGIYTNIADNPTALASLKYIQSCGLKIYININNNIAAVNRNMLEKDIENTVWQIECDTVAQSLQAVKIDDGKILLERTLAQTDWADILIY